MPIEIETGSEPPANAKKSEWSFAEQWTGRRTAKSGRQFV